MIRDKEIVDCRECEVSERFQIVNFYFMNLSPLIENM